MPVLHERGYLIPAIDTDSTDYYGCARRLAKTIRYWHPNANISVLTAKQCQDPVFDHVISLPYDDQGGYANDWQVFQASPYRQTIKLEADMVAAGPIDHWWNLFEKRNVVISQGCRTYKDLLAESRYYRKCFDANNLPDVYNAITYWRLSDTAREFFDLVRKIFEQWTEFRKLIKYPEETASTDLVYAMAAQIMGPELVTLPRGLGPTIVHMKRHINSLQCNDWTQELIWENNPLRINTIAQWGFVHYHQKEWSNE